MPRDAAPIEFETATGPRGDEHDFTVEAVPGLPGPLPRGEFVLWQGRPRALALARASLSLTWVLGYFVLLAAWRVGLSAGEVGLVAALPLAIPFLVLGLAAAAVLYLVAAIQARATIYTITTERVAMRIGAAVTLTVNLPFAKIAAADLARGPGGTGTIAIRTTGEARLSYLILWPHVRPWRIRDPQAALRAIPDADTVAGILSEAVAARRNRPAVARPYPIAAE